MISLLHSGFPGAPISLQVSGRMEVSRGKESRSRFQLHSVYKVHYLPDGRLDSAQLLMLKDPLLLEVNQRNQTSVEM